MKKIDLYTYEEAMADQRKQDPPARKAKSVPTWQIAVWTIVAVILIIILVV